MRSYRPLWVLIGLYPSLIVYMGPYVSLYFRMGPNGTLSVLNRLYVL